MEIKNYKKIVRFKFIIIFLIVFFVGNIFSTNASTINSNLSNAGGDTLKNGLVGWWTMDGADIVNNVVDKSGSGNTGYLQGFTSTSSAKVSGKLGQALSLNGTNNYMASKNVVNITNTTISAWVKIDKVPTQNGLIAGFINGIESVTHDKNLYIGTDGKLYFYVYDTGPKTTSAPSTAIPLNTWVHVVGVADGSSAKTYINGVEVGTISAGNTYSSYTVPDIFIGGATGNIPVGGGYLKQKIDDVRIYNRALSSSEIKSLYNLGADKINSNLSNAGGDTLKNGLVGWWTMDGADIVNNVVDKSGNSNTGYLQGFTSTSSAKVAGKLGQALKFNKTSGNVIINSSTSLQPSFITLSGWLKYTKTPVDGEGSIIEKSSNYGIRSNGVTKINFVSRTVNNSWSLATNSNNTALRVGIWYHVAITYDGTTATYYVNGVPDGTDTSKTGALYVGTDDLNISKDSNGKYLDSFIDDVRIYNRALSSSEIKSLYNLGADKINSNLSNAGGDTLKNGLVGWWTMDGADIVNNVVDRSGTGNTGYMVNMATATAKVSGKLGQALNFDGVNDYVSVGNPSNLNFGTGSFSYGLWVYATGLTTAYDMPIYKGGGSAGSPGFDMELGSGPWSSNIADNSVLKQRNFSNSPILNRWAHLFVTVNRSTNQHCVFLNGVQVGSCLDISTFGSVSGSANLVFGRQATYALKGKIDDIRIYNRALSSSEVKALYNLGI